MPSSIRTLIGAAMLAMANGQAVILSAKGDSGTSLGLQVDTKNSNDANFISDTEINANVVNECGRTLAAGNIDIGENTENALAANQVTQVKKGSKVTITMDQVNANGTGPFACDLDLTSNANGLTGQTALTTTESDSKNGQTTLTVTLPKDMACAGASVGNVCTIRCRNAQDFGGCVAVQQTDVTPSENDPSTITTAQTLKGIQSQIQQNKLDLQAAIAGNEQATKVSDQGLDIAQAILDSEPTLVAGVQKEIQTNTISAAAAATTSATANNNNKGNGKKNKGNGNNANAATKGNGNNANAATKGNGNNAASANAATGNGNNASGNGSGNNGKGNNNAFQGSNNGNNNKRESLAERRKRYVNAGVAFAEDGAGN